MIIQHSELICASCGQQTEHELLSLSRHLRASRCTACGYVVVFSSDLKWDYAQDFIDRVKRLPDRFQRELAADPRLLAYWPYKAIRKPFKILRELERVSDFDVRDT